MAATASGYNDWDRSSPGSSPIMTARGHPERPIKPLPKRRLRSRLSPEQAESIVYPQAPSAGPLFSFPYGDTDKSPTMASRHQTGDHHHTCSCGQPHAEESDGDDDRDFSKIPLPYQWSPSSRPRAQQSGRPPSHPANGFAHPPPPPDSTTSSADGYESFENTNNKKKRKIPLSERGGHHTSLSPELASMSVSQVNGDPGAEDEGVGGGGQYYAPPSAQSTGGIASGTGISGPGRGRYGRSDRERRPLAPVNRVNSGAGSGRRRDWTGPTARGQLPEMPPEIKEVHDALTDYLRSAHPPPSDHGIIGAAIANAAEQTAAVPEKGNENVSLLQQHSKSTPPKTKQFTFTCESDSSNKMVWPGQTGAMGTSTSTAPPMAQSTAAPGRPPRGVATQGTQTSPGMNGAPGTAPAQHSQQQAANNQQQGQQARPPRPRRTAAKEYALAARQRKLQQEYQNFHNPPKREDIWICEFCEYESIFGRPPVALIRTYEEKDRKERKALAERRRLLEKAKMKGKNKKKGNKNSKNTANNNQQNQPPPSNQRYDQLDNMPLPNDDLGDDFVDDYDDAMAVPPPPQSMDQMPGSYVNDYVERGPPPGTAKGAARKATPA